MKFKLGKTVATRGAVALSEARNFSLLDLLHRHVSGDWGYLGKDDCEANEAALKSGARILSAYTVPGGKIWVITEAQDDNGVRLSTTCLLPEEY